MQNILRYFRRMDPNEQGYHEEHGKVNGLGLITTAFFIVGEMAGSGILALPSATAGVGWVGPLLIIFMCACAAYTGNLLGECMLMVREQHEDTRVALRDPYCIIGLKAFGRWASILVTTCTNFTLFGVSCVFLLLAAQNISELIEDAFPAFKVSYCYIVIAVALFLAPFTLFGTPNDFWPIGIIAMLCTFLACILIFAQSLSDIVSHVNCDVKRAYPSYDQFSIAYGTIAFAFGGHAIFPSFIVEMRRPSKFIYTIALSFSALIIMYLLVAVTGYAAYGSDVKTNIILSLTAGGIKIAITVMITLHLLSAFVIVANPVSLQLEELFKMTNGFTWKKILTRFSVVLVILFVAETIPHFGYILSLVGGSATNCLVFVFPPMFYVKLARNKGDWPERRIAIHTYIILGEIFLIGLYGGITCTITAVKDIVSPNSFVPPCYVDINAASV